MALLKTPAFDSHQIREKETDALLVGDLLHELADVEGGGIVVDNQVEVDPLPSQDVHGLFVVQLVQQLLDDVEREGARMNHFQVSSRHLQNRLGVFRHGNDDPGTSLDRPDRFGVPESGRIDGLVEDRARQRQGLQRVAEGRGQQEVGVDEKRTERKLIRFF